MKQERKLTVTYHSKMSCKIKKIFRGTSLILKHKNHSLEERFRICVIKSDTYVF